ncbi:MAG: gfo/Idh/MocA family oxidoreductase, partial [Prolixibacteraceae bacterium]|nr:gfo/Idh/MocA family oxidoreductase [Prolixibacteraceae bacterium]
VGSKATLIAESYGANWKVYKNGDEVVPETKVSIDRIPDDPNGGGRHEMHFVNCCKNGGEPASRFEYSGPFNEMVVMGNLAVRMQSLQKTFLWDSENLKVTNLAPDEKLRTTKLLPFSSDVVTRNIERQAKQRVEWNAQEMCEEWIKHNYREGWNL